MEESRRDSDVEPSRPGVRSVRERPAAEAAAAGDDRDRADCGVGDDATAGDDGNDSAAGDDGNDRATGDADESDAADETLDDRVDCADVLEDRYRRRTLRCLRRADGAVPVADLAREVVAGTAGKPPDAVTLDERKRMYTALDRTHLPALAAAGLVERRPGDAVALADDSDDPVTLADDPDGSASARTSRG